MNRDQLNKLTHIGPASNRLHPSLREFADETPRTLLYGYDVDRQTYHVYGDDDGTIFLHVYTPEGTIRVVNLTTEGFLATDEIVPNKRLYPQYCDYGFCAYLKTLGAYLSFTTYEEPTKDGLYFGALAERIAA